MKAWIAAAGVIVLLSVLFGILRELIPTVPPGWIFATGVFTGLVAEGVRRELR